MRAMAKYDLSETICSCSSDDNGVWGEDEKTLDDDDKVEQIEKRDVNWGQYLLLMRAMKQYRRLCKAHVTMMKKELLMECAEHYQVDINNLLYLINFGEDVFNIRS